MSAAHKVIFIIWTENPGGIEKTLMYYPVNLKKYNYNIFILRPRKDAVEMFPEKYFREKKYGDTKNRRLYPKLFKYVRENKDSIFHVLNAGPIILLILKIAGCKNIIYHIRGTVYWKKNYLKIPMQILWKAALSNRVKIIANSEFSREMFLQRANKKYPVEVIYNPFEKVQKTTPGDPVNKKSGKGLSVFYVGRLVNGKNLFLWLDIAKKLDEKFHHITFHFYGKGSLEKQLYDYARHLGIQDKLFFHGFLRNIEKAYQAHDLLMFLSEYESFGNVVVESILYGTPVIAKPIPSIKEIFVNYSEFLLNEDLDYFEQIVKKTENVHLLTKVAETAQKDFAERFSMKNHINRIAQLYGQY